MNDAIRKIVIPVAAIAALGYGGAQLAGASGNSPAAATPATTAPVSGGDGEAADDATSPDKTDAAEQPDGAEQSDAAEQVTGSAADQAKAAALKAVPGGTIGEIHAETQDSADQSADKPEPGDTPDPSYESKIAYDVDVTKADGSEVTVHLDKSFAVLGTEAEQHHGDGGDGDGSHGQD